MAINQGPEANMPPAGRDQQTGGSNGERHFTPSTAENASYETGAGATGFDSPATGSLALDNPEVDLGDDVEDINLDSRSDESELDDYEDDLDEEEYEDAEYDEDDDDEDDDDDEGLDEVE